MKKHIVCLGDSNTHGYCADPADCAGGTLHRFNEAERWTCLLQKALGEDYLVVEEGLCGRTTAFHDPFCKWFCALDYLWPCLKSHEPLALLVIMLGTNDTKQRIGASAEDIAQGLGRLARTAQRAICWGPEGKPNILLIAPPPIGAGVASSTVAGEMGRGAVEKSRQLPALFQAVAAETGCHFLDAGACEYNQIDFMHLTRRGHAQLAQLLEERIPTLVSPGGT